MYIFQYLVTQTNLINVISYQIDYTSTPILRHIISYHIIDLQRQNRLKVGTNKPKLKVKMQSSAVSDDDIRKRLLEQPRFELAAKGVFRLGRCYIKYIGRIGVAI